MAATTKFFFFHVSHRHDVTRGSLADFVVAHEAEQGIHNGLSEGCPRGLDPPSRRQDKARNGSGAGGRWRRSEDLERCEQVVFVGRRCPDLIVTTRSSSSTLIVIDHHHGGQIIHGLVLAPLPQQRSHPENHCRLHHSGEVPQFDKLATGL